MKGGSTRTSTTHHKGQHCDGRCLEVVVCDACDRCFFVHLSHSAIQVRKYEHVRARTLLIISILHSSHAMHATEADTWHSGDGKHAHSRCHRTLTTSALTEMCNVVDKSVSLRLYSLNQLAARVIPLSTAAAAIDARPDTETSFIPLYRRSTIT